MCVNNFKLRHQRHSKVKIFQSSLNNGPFYVIKGFFAVNVKQEARNVFCICILDDAIYDPDIFSDTSVSQKTRLVVIADLRQNFFNAISD